MIKNISEFDFDKTVIKNNSTYFSKSIIIAFQSFIIMVLINIISDFPKIIASFQGKELFPLTEIFKKLGLLVLPAFLFGFIFTLFNKQISKELKIETKQIMPKNIDHFKKEINLTEDIIIAFPGYICSLFSFGTVFAYTIITHNFIYYFYISDLNKDLKIKKKRNNLHVIRCSPLLLLLMGYFKKKYIISCNKITFIMENPEELKSKIRNT